MVPGLSGGRFTPLGTNIALESVQPFESVMVYTDVPNETPVNVPVPEYGSVPPVPDTFTLVVEFLQYMVSAVSTTSRGSGWVTVKLAVVVQPAYEPTVTVYVNGARPLMSSADGSYVAVAPPPIQL